MRTRLRGFVSWVGADAIGKGGTGGRKSISAGWEGCSRGEARRRGFECLRYRDRPQLFQATAADWQRGRHDRRAPPRRGLLHCARRGETALPLDQTRRLRDRMLTDGNNALGPQEGRSSPILLRRHPTQSPPIAGSRTPPTTHLPTPAVASGRSSGRCTWARSQAAVSRL